MKLKTSIKTTIRKTGGYGHPKCLVTYTPEEAITHEIEVTFNDEQVSGEFNFHVFCPIEYIKVKIL